MRVRIRQVYYESAQRGHLDPRFCPYLNDRPLSPYFENEVLARLHAARDHETCDYYGVFSWKFRAKHDMDGGQLFESLEEDRYFHDVYSFLEKGTRSGRSSAEPNTFFDLFHPNLLEIGRTIVRRLFEVDLGRVRAPPIYYNHWISTSGLFDGYCRQMLIPAMDLMEQDEHLNCLVFEDSKYGMSQPARPVLGHRMNAESCLAVFGVPYYPHHSFVLERLPSIYFAIKNVDVKYL